MNNTNQKNQKACYFCSNNIKKVDYKNVILLRKFINTSGKIFSRKKSGNCMKHQRMVAKSVKRARIIGLLPFVAR